MSDKDEGGPAFPVPETSGGMSLRDYFAAKSIHGVLIVFADEDIPDNIDVPRSIAMKCYAIADAMIAERVK